jgi:lipopolysaccharide export system protein LptC
MTRDLQAYSRLVYGLKITLPILALAILATLFLFARRIDFEGALPYAEVDIEGLANDPRLERPEFSTITAGGDAIRVAAATARPGATPRDPLEASEILAVYDLADGRRLTLQAREGLLDSDGDRLNLRGAVTLISSDGFTLTAPVMASRLGALDISAEGGVDGTAPFGTIAADRMTVSGPAGSSELVFKGNVRLVYNPQN